MSKEAKVGLLLGLIFIVAIAVILKGVHRESMSELGEIQTLADSRTVHPEPMPLNAVQNLSDGGSSYSGVSGSPANPPAGISAEGMGGATAAAGNSPDLADRLRPAGPIIYNAAPVTPDAASGDVRYRTPLPGLTNRNGAPAEAGRTDSIQPDSGLYQHAVQAVIDPQALNSIRPGQRSILPEGLTELTRLPGQAPVKPAAPIDSIPAAKAPEPGSYTVAKGDDLSKIALKAYGPVEGKRWVNVQRIFNANAKVMKDMDQVTVGQVLTIPALPAKVTPAPTPAVAGTAALKPAASAPAPAAAATAGSYTVAKGDSLWSIAQKTLGNGKRFKEIVNLNGTLLNNENAIKIGMKLKLPAR